MSRGRPAVFSFPTFAMRFVMLLTALVAFVTFGRADDSPTPTRPAGAPWVAELRDVKIPMRDGKVLLANVLLPKAAGKYPCVLVQTPYNKDRMGREFGDRVEPGEAARGSEKAWRHFDRDHYAYVFVDWRGFYGSKDAMIGIDKRRWKRGHDGYDCVEWCAAQEWCNGKVGTWGGSALGKQQFDTAAEQPPHLVCAVPLIAFQGARYSTYFEGGVLIETMLKTHERLGFGVAETVLKHRLPSRLWEFARTLTYRPERIAVPCLMISGWWDNFPRDVIEQFADLLSKGKDGAKASKLVMGPWAHTAVDLAQQGDLEFKDSEGYSTRLTLKFFDYYLREQKDNGWDKVPSIHLFQCGQGWVTGDRYDKLLGTPKTFHLHADGAIVSDAPPAATAERPGTRTFSYDPRQASPTIGGQNLPPLSHGPKAITELFKRGDVVVYQTPVLEQPLKIRGEIVLSLQVSCNRVDCDVHVRLADIDEQGRAYLIGETIQRASLRDGVKKALLVPGVGVEVGLKLPPHAYTWGKGHRVALLLTGGNTPRYERNTHTGADEWDAASALSCDITLHAGRLELPLID